MKVKKSVIYGKNKELGAYREYLVSQMYKNIGYKVIEASKYDDYSNEIDLVAFKNNKKIYIQVRGFHSNWRSDVFSKLIAKAKRDCFEGYVCYVNKLGKVYKKKIA